MKKKFALKIEPFFHRRSCIMAVVGEETIYTSSYEKEYTLASGSG